MKKLGVLAAFVTVAVIGILLYIDAGSVCEKGEFEERKQF